MSIVSSDILLKFSTKVGAAGNANAGTAAGSLGKYISTTQITNATLHNLFDQITGDENAASAVDYRCIFVHNAHASLTWQDIAVYILTQVAGGASIAIGIDPTAASAIGSASAQALEIANETTTPAGVLFLTPASLAEAASAGSVANGQCKAIWIRRTAANTTAVSSDGATLRLQGNSL